MHKQAMQSTNRLLVLAALGLLAPTRPACADSGADCFLAAANYQHVNPIILRAISWQESRDTPGAKHRNANGSTDFGLMQINSVHLPALARFGIDSGTLMDPCASVYIAAWHLRSKMNKYGNTWDAVGAYHSETPALREQYAGRIRKILVEWGVLRLSRAGQ